MGAEAGGRERGLHRRPPGLNTDGKVCMKRTLVWATLLSLSQQIRCRHTADLELSPENETDCVFHRNCSAMKKFPSDVEEMKRDLKDFIVSEYSIPFHSLFV